MEKKTGLPRRESFFRNTVERFLRHKLAMVSLCFFTLEVLLILLLPVVMELDPYSTHPGFFDKPPSEQFILGTDSVGRDVFARLVYGGRDP